MISKYLKLNSWIFFWLVVACTQSEYTRLASVELAKGLRMDSVILGLNLGDTQIEFREKCMSLNQRKMVTQGARGSVVFDFTDSLEHSKPTTIRILIFAFFDENEIISDFLLEFSYPSWAPWNKEFQSDVLEPRLVNLLTHWYGGNSFITVKIGDKNVPVKLDCNRRIVVKQKDSQSIMVMVQDITHLKFNSKTR